MKQFACFQLDTQNECLWRSGERIALTPKLFAVLRYLVDNPQRLVTHDELLEALWPETYVQPQVLRTYVLELRKVLGDDAGNSRFIQTVPKRGYRFISIVAENQSYASAHSRAQLRHIGGLVGRAADLARLEESLSLAHNGERQLIFITGEVGIGKTALVDCFCRQLDADGAAFIARGQSVEGFGGKEAYYPVMEVISQLCNENGKARNLRLLEQKAPSWYAQLPCATKSGAATANLIPASDRTGNRNSDRMLNEICEAFEAIAAEALLILAFEDLHWADNSTLDLISALARRRAPARLLLLATYRPGDMNSAHPLKGLKQDLLTRKLCTETALGPLGRSAVAEYLIDELKQQKLPTGLASFVHQHSEGNPLFMIAILEHMIAQDHLRQEDAAWKLTTELAEIDMGVPAALSELIELQIQRLDSSDQRLLEAASLIGVVFPAWAAAAALNADLEEIEEQYESLMRKLSFLNLAGQDELPDGTRSAFYVFAHGLYREVLYRRQPPTRLARRHLRVAEKLLELFAGREQDVAPELAVHFEAAGDWPRAAEAISAAAENAVRRGAPEEGTKLMRHALRLLENLPRREREIAERKVRKGTAPDDLMAGQSFA